ncbi:biotin transporter BioY [Selenomonas sp. F0473]|uniref:biotin transporter BioY n=1 Tax=Selenomonas sp. F0473 TaxID=999423 RepID=UPI00029E284D|nr:biotin transporter BioY [Selenomonas sp. F0473]EKU70931.1 hypothetical protein HMPREF9161_01480 [Selenomonas sp. F0473]
MSQYDEKFFSIRNTTRMALCIALICVSAYIAIPVPFMAPLTMQTFALCLTALVLTPGQTAVVLIGYTLLGAVGLPVFAGGVGGLAIIFSPRGGFFLGFLVAYTLMSFLKGSTPSFRRYAVVAVLVSVPVTYIFATLWLVVLFGDKFAGIAAAFGALAQYVPGDMIKAAAAAGVGGSLNRRLRYM